MFNTETEKPHQVLASIETEQILLGGLLIDPTPAHEVIALVNPEDFFRKDHRIIFAVMQNLLNEGTPIDVILVAERASLCAKKDLLQYVVEIAGASCGSTNATSYARVIREHAVKRTVLEAAHGIIAHVNQSHEQTAEDVVSHAQSQIIRVSDSMVRESEISSPADAFARCVTEIDRRMHSEATLFGLSSGFAAIDQYTCGYGPGELIVLAGRPSMGKSTLAICIGAAMAVKQKSRGVFFSVEMPERQVMNKLIACLARIDYKLLKNPKLVKDHDEFWHRVQRCAEIIRGSGFNIADVPGVHINQILAQARRMHLSQPLGWIMIDHMHLVGADGKSEIERLTQISNSTKRLARELQIPVILLAQLSRAVEARPDKRPMMSDIRGCGAIEQDADIIHFVYRDDYYNKSPDNPNRGLVEVDTAKQRDGELGVAVLENAYAQSRLLPTDRKVIRAEPARRSLAMVDGL